MRYCEFECRYLLLCHMERGLNTPSNKWIYPLNFTLQLTNYLHSIAILLNNQAIHNWFEAIDAFQIVWCGKKLLKEYFNPKLYSLPLDISELKKNVKTICIHQTFHSNSHFGFTFKLFTWKLCLSNSLLFNQSR